MTEIAKAVIAGHEAKGNASIVQADDGSLKIKLTDFWIAPGAPDVRIVISPRKDGQPDDSATEISLVPDATSTLEYDIPSSVDIGKMKTVIVYCKQYFAHFGHGNLRLV